MGGADGGEWLPGGRHSLCGWRNSQELRVDLMGGKNREESSNS